MTSKSALFIVNWLAGLDGVLGGGTCWVIYLGNE